MCGIAGILYRDPARPVEAERLKAMADAIAHRGPDAEGFFRASGVGLAHRRLAIIDLSTGDQPLGNEDGSIQVVFNGEIYNFAALRARLESRGHRFRTRSDTEVLVHLYEEEGDALVTHLRGMFAFALWDAPRARLLLARDRVGLKPLYYCRDGEKLLFGSELKAILTWPGVDRSLDLAALDDYLAYGMVPGERSIFQAVHKLAPAHCVAIGRDDWDAQPRRYWQLRLTADGTRSVDDWKEAIAEKVEETVRAHQIADVPVGAFLSGGLDSSVMVALQSNLSSRPLETFSIGFREGAFSELPYARQVAQRFGTCHTEEIVTPDSAGLLEELVFSYDEPFADSSAIPTLCVARLARRSVKVVVSGDGGDEAFGGYARYAHDLEEAAWRRRLPGWFRRAVLAPIARAWPKADWLPRPMRAKTRLTNLALDAPEAYANTVAICRQPLRHQILSADIRAELRARRAETTAAQGFRRAPPDDPLAGMIAADMDLLLPDDFLVKVDRASMACGLEVRPPLVDHELLELTARLPSAYKVRGRETKWVFKETFRERLPVGFTRRPKQGFEIPVDSWLRGPLRERVAGAVLGAGSPVAGLLDPTTVARLWREHQSGIGRHGAVLWSLLVLAAWAERYLKA